MTEKKEKPKTLSSPLLKEGVFNKRNQEPPWEDSKNNTYSQVFEWTTETEIHSGFIDSF